MKLTREELVAKVRALVLEGHSRSEVARRLGVSRTWLRAIAPGEPWKPKGTTIQCLERAVRRRAEGEARAQARKAAKLPKPIKEPKRHDVGDGRMLTSSEIAAETGVRRQTINAWVRAGVHGRELLAPSGTRVSELSTARGWKLDTWRGVKTNPAELATIYGICPKTMYSRLRAGMTGDRLIAGATREVEDYGAAVAARKVSHVVRARKKHLQTYKTGLTCDEWVPIVAHAREHGIKAAAKKFCLPRGAIDCMLTGREEFVD
jgi:transposase-like protein